MCLNLLLKVIMPVFLHTDRQDLGSPIPWWEMRYVCFRRTMEHQVGRVLKDHLVQLFLAKAWLRQDGPPSYSHPVQMNLKSVDCWGIHQSPADIIQLLIVLMKSGPLVSSPVLCRSNLYLLALVFCMWLLVNRGFHLLCRHLLNTGTWL